MNRKRIIVLFCVLALVAVSALGGWVVGSRITSPAEAAARTAPPPPSPILVPVEERVLSSQIVARGMARFGLPRPISIAPSALKATAGLITTLPSRNTQFKEGDVMLTASGRPVLVLQGEIPAYRDLVPGISGNDVRQLEQGLDRLGFEPGAVDGTYDEQTSGAVAKWYNSAGYEPFGPTTEQLANVRTLELGLGDAKKNKFLTAGTAAAADLAVEPSRAKAAYANKAAADEIAAAERALARLRPWESGTVRAAASARLQLAQVALKSAQQESATAVRALTEHKVAEFDAKLAAERVDQLAADLDKAKRKLGVQVPVDEIVFIAALPVRVEQLTGLVGGAASGPVMTVTDNKLAIDSSLPLDTAPLVKPGMTVAIDEQALGIKAKGVVETVADTPGTHGIDGYHIYFAVSVGETSTPMQGFSLRLTIPIKSTKGVVTTVPVSALSLAADGTSRVQVENNGALEYIAVEPGLAADGFVEVNPLSGTLKPGQLVVVGHANNENNDNIAMRP